MNPVEHDLKCPECGAKMVLKVSKFKNNFWYGCEKYFLTGCTGSHGANPDGSPLGTPANKPTKAARMKAHATFDVLWKSGTMSRNQAYAWLRARLGLSKEECHIGKFDLQMCEKVIAICRSTPGYDHLTSKEEHE